MSLGSRSAGVTAAFSVQPWPRYAYRKSASCCCPIETVVDAVLELDRSHGGTLAIGKLMEARVETGCPAGPDAGRDPGFGRRRGGRPEALHAAGGCRGGHSLLFSGAYPLPRQATKSIEVVPEGFQLTIQTRH